MFSPPSNAFPPSLSVSRTLFLNFSRFPIKMGVASVARDSPAQVQRWRGSPTSTPPRRRAGPCCPYAWASSEPPCSWISCGLPPPPPLAPPCRSLPTGLSRNPESSSSPTSDLARNRVIRYPLRFRAPGGTLLVGSCEARVPCLGFRFICRIAIDRFDSTPALMQHFALIF